MPLKTPKGLDGKLEKLEWNPIYMSITKVCTEAFNPCDAEATFVQKTRPQIFLKTIFFKHNLKVIGCDNVPEYTLGNVGIHQTVGVLLGMQNYTPSHREFPDTV